MDASRAVRLETLAPSHPALGILRARYWLLRGKLALGRDDLTFKQMLSSEAITEG